MNNSPLFTPSFSTLAPSIRLTPLLANNMPADDEVDSAASSNGDDLTLISSSHTPDSSIDIPAHSRASPAHDEANVRAITADQYRRWSYKAALIAPLMAGSTYLIDQLKGELGLPILIKILFLGVIPIVLLFTTIMLRMCSEFIGEEIDEERQNLFVGPTRGGGDSPGMQNLALRA